MNRHTLFLMIGWLILLGGFTLLIAEKPVINALVPQDFTTITINKEVSKTHAFPIEDTNLRSLKIWGDVEGDGKVTIWLVNPRGEKLRVFANKKRGMESITGFATTPFADGACEETCFIPPEFTASSYELTVELDNAKFLLYRIAYSTQK